MLERDYQAKLIKKLRKMFPGIIILKNDTDYQQGIPDLSLFYERHWAFLEVKPHVDASHEPNQDWFVEQADRMSFGAFIYPENEKEVLRALEQSFSS